MEISKIVLSDEAVNVIDGGVWVPIEDMPGVKLKVLGLKSKTAQDAQIAINSAIRAENEGKPLTDEQARFAMRKLLGEVVLLDFEGFTDGGKKVKFDRELVKKWTTSRNGQDFADLIYVAAKVVDSNAEKFVDQLVKN